MRYRLMATYRGVPYEAGLGPSAGDVVLFAACPPPEGLGFEPATGHWRKSVISAEVDALWESRPVGIFRGEPCIVLDDLGDRLHIAYLGTEASRAARLGYWQVDRGVFELLTSREEVGSLTEERVDKPLRWVPPPEQVPQPASAPPTNPYDTAAWIMPPVPPTPPAVGNGVAPAPNGYPSPGTPRGGGPAGAPWPGPVVEPGTFGDSGPGTGAGTRSGALAGPGMESGADDGPGAAERQPGPGSAPVSTPAGPWRQPAGAQPAAGTFGQPDAVTPEHPPAGAAVGGHSAASPPQSGAGTDAGGRAARRQRVPTREIFCELADLAAIPRTAYALEAEVEGAMCLLAHAGGFEVFVATDGARHEVRTFADEEAAYFYLFGVLAAEAVRSGSLVAMVPPVAGVTWTGNRTDAGARY
jgi:hypothetical protein